MKLVFYLLLITILFSCKMSNTGEIKSGTIIRLKASEEQNGTSLINKTAEILKQRINYFNDSVILTTDSVKGEVIVKIPGEKDTAFYKDLMLTKGNFRMMETYENDKIIDEFNAINDTLVKYGNFGLNLLGDPDSYSKEKLDQYKDSPLFSVLKPPFNVKKEPIEGPVIGHAQNKDTGKINDIFSESKVSQLLPDRIKLRWKKYPVSNNIYGLVGLKKPVDYKPVTSAMIAKASVEESRHGRLQVRIKLKEEHHTDWAELTKKNIGNFIATVLDGKVYGIPVVQSEIKGGNAVLPGFKDQKEAEMIAAILKSGSLNETLNIEKVKLVRES